MQNLIYDEMYEIEASPFSALVGEDIISFIIQNSPRKVLTRISRSLEHFGRSTKLEGIDEEMGAIRLIAAEEELVVAIFELLKLKSDSFAEHKDFVSKFRSHVVKLAFYPVLFQFRIVVGDILRDGFTFEGLENIVTWSAKPVVEGKQIKVVLCDESGKEIIRADPFATTLSKGDIRDHDIVPLLLADLSRTIEAQHNVTLRQFLTARSDFRNHLLYATDGGSAKLGETLADLRKHFEQILHDLLWVLALIVGGKPPSKQWGIASQFIGVYRLALIEAKILKADNTIDEAVENIQLV
jgi:hypothetical protein